MATQHSSKDSDSNCILIVTVTKVEAQAVREVFSQAMGMSWARSTKGSKTYYDLGVTAGVPVFMVQSEMGIATPAGALLTVRQAIEDLRPQAIIMCGIAFGLRPDKQNIGDILVAKQIEYYEPQKLDAQRGHLPRGDRATVSDLLLDRFRSGDNDWSGAQVHFGLVLSGEKLVNSPEFTKKLLDIEPEAIGGEMEGAGLYVAAREAKADWILVKGVCDWADGNKGDDTQPLAAHNAAQFVMHVLQLGGWDGSGQSATRVTNLVSRLELKYDEQRRLLDRLRIHQANLGELLLQKAQFGITVPLELINSIRQQEREIDNIDRNLGQLDDDLASLEEAIQRSNLMTEPSGRLGATLESLYLDFGDGEYHIEAPYPILGVETTLLSESQQYVTQFAGGFEVRTTHVNNRPGMKIAWYRHGRLISPVLDRDNKKLILPLGRHVQVGRLEWKPWKQELSDGVPVERISKGIWTLVPPAPVSEIVTRMETPQGYNSYIISTRTVFEGPWEVWSVLSEDGPIRLWFYFHDWSVAPLIDEELLALSFPPSIDLANVEGSSVRRDDQVQAKESV